MRIAIILNYINYNQTSYCVNQLRKSNVDHIVVVDNASPNESFSILTEKFNKINNIHVVHANYNGGYARGNNIGLRFVESTIGIAKDNIIFIINPDSIATLKNINELCLAIDRNDNAGMVTPMMNGTIKSVWHHLTTTKAFFFNSWIIRWVLNKFGIREGGFYNIHQTKDNYIPVEVVMGAFFAIRQDIFKKIGYFDEDTFMYYEEEILYWKLKSEGYQNYLVTSANFVHEGRGSTNLGKLEFKRINDASRLYLLKKYHNVGGLYVAVALCVNMFDNMLFRVLRR